MATSDDILKSLVDTLHIYRKSHDWRLDRVEQQIANLRDKIELLTGTLSEVNSTLRDFSALTRKQSELVTQQESTAQRNAKNVADLIRLAPPQQDAISALLVRN